MRKTALFDWHIAQNAKMVDFCGCNLPVLYNGMSIIDSHLHTRSKVSLFDVSHMQQLRIVGRNSVDFLHSLVVGDLRNLKFNHSTLTLLTNQLGGIIDDTIVTKIHESELNLVVNASQAEKDLKYLETAAKFSRSDGNDVEIILQNRSLIALQGPLAAECLQLGLSDAVDLNKISFMTTFVTNLFGKSVRIGRCGYTGEDGFEISVKHEDVTHVADCFLANQDCKPAGLGARDTLRLEAGLCLYGNDIDINTTPIEASLMWTIAKNRRDIETDSEEVMFPGYQTIVQEQLKEKKWTRKRVGITNNIRRGIPADSIIHNSKGDYVGNVTSGTLSPVLQKGIGMAYIKRPYHAKKDEEFYIDVRGKKMSIQITSMPFVPTNYFVAKKD